MDSQTLIMARRYYDLCQAGEEKKVAAEEVSGNKNYAAIELTPEYKAIVAAMSEVLRGQVKQELEITKRRQLQAYSKLLDKGDELIDEAQTTEEKLVAQKNQRENLASGVIDNAVAWDGEDRNQTGMGEILDGVILN